MYNIRVTYTLILLLKKNKHRKKTIAFLVHSVYNIVCKFCRRTIKKSFFRLTDVLTDVKYGQHLEQLRKKFTESRYCYSLKLNISFRS